MIAYLSNSSMQIQFKEVRTCRKFCMFQKSNKNAAQNHTCHNALAWCAAPGTPQATTPKVKIEPRKASSTPIAFENTTKRAADRKILRFLCKLVSSKVDGVPGRPELAASRPTFTFGLAASMSTITGILLSALPGRGCRRIQSQTLKVDSNLVT